MIFDDDLTKQVLEHADIVKVISSYLNVIKKGKNYLAVCPFHDDTNPSLTINPEKRIFKCFVCGKGGSAIYFVQEYEHISFLEARKKVAEISGFYDERLETSVKPKVVDEKKVPLLKCLHDLTVYYQYALNTEEGKIGLDYFENRKLDAKIRDKYLLGYAMNDGIATCNFLQSKGHSLKTIDDVGIATINGDKYSDKNHGRVIFPICDANGNVIGYSARRIADGPEAKYVNSPETYLFHKSSVLYNLHIAKEACRHSEYIYICEGFMDVFALAKIGIDSAVAIMGTALTNEHVQIFRKLGVEIRMCLDGDLPGQTATLKSIKLLQKSGLNNIRVVYNNNSTKDPDEILNEDGEEALKSYLNNLISPLDFELNYYSSSGSIKTNDQKTAIIKEILPTLTTINSKLELDNYLRKLSAATGYDIDSLRELASRYRNNKSDKIDNEILTLSPEKKILRKLQLAERELLYQMANNQEAVSAFEEKVGTFYEDIYRKIANYIVSYSKISSDFDISDLLASLEASEFEDKNEIIEELTNLMFEKNHPEKCTKELLDNLISSINDEKTRINEKDMLEQSLEGKDPLEQARILADYNRRKAKNMK